MVKYSKELGAADKVAKARGSDLRVHFKARLLLRCAAPPPERPS